VGNPHRPKHAVHFYNKEKKEQQPELHVDGKVY
jgi:hypothetical protein